MTIDETFTAMTACPIQPVKAKFTDVVNSTYLGVRSIADNLNNACTLYWALMDNEGNEYMHGNFLIGGANYTNWDGDNLYPFTLVGTQLGLTFI